MSYAFGAAGAFTSSSFTTSLALPFVSGSTAGQFLVVPYFVRDSATTITIPSGWTSLVAYEGNRTGIFGREAVGGESGNLNIVLSTSDKIIAQMARFTTGATGWNIATLIHATATVEGFSQVDIPTPALTISQANTLVLLAGATNDYLNPYTSPGGFTEIGEGGLPDPEFIGGAWAYQIQTTATNISAGIFDSASVSTAHTSRAHIVSMLAPTVVGGSSAIPSRARNLGALLRL